MGSVNQGLFSSATGEWSTPQDLFDELNAEFHFDLDPCATAENAKCAKFYTKKDDGLNQRWHGSVFVNPPYGRQIAHWVRKSAREAMDGVTVVMLIPARTDTNWWHGHIWDTEKQQPKQGVEVRFLRGRVKFGGHKSGAPFPSAVVVFRPVVIVG
jgi:site-specific DNA-methyltransferase (adenine-specific)